MVTCSAARRRSTRRGVGTGKTVTVTGITLSGAAAGELHAGEHDGDDDGGHHGGDADADGDGGEQGLRRDDDGDGDSCTLTGVVGGDVVTCSAARRRSTRRSVGTGKTVTVDAASR